jgi:hypothetical protein
MGLRCEAASLDEALRALSWQTAWMDKSALGAASEAGGACAE